MKSWITLQKERYRPQHTLLSPPNVTLIEVKRSPYANVRWLEGEKVVY